MNPRIWMARIAAMFRKSRLERELNQDIQDHLQMATEENLRQGMNPREAAEAARRSFGGAEQMKEEFRDQRGIPALETIGRETRVACRSLWRAPGYTVLAILTLALGIGANSAIFSAVNAVLFHPGGISESNRLVVIRAKYDKLKLGNLVISLNDFKNVGGGQEVFSATAIAKTASFSYNEGASPQRLTALRVSWRWFDVFGVKPVKGRVFTPEEDQPNNNHVVLLTYAGWQRTFGGDPSIVGKAIELDGLPYRVVGVMGPDYTTGVNELGGLSNRPHDLFMPLGAHADSPQGLYSESFLGVARLQHGVGFAGAQAFMGVLNNREFETRPGLKENGWGLWILPYTDFTGGDMKTPMLILWGAVALVLLIACANIAGLTLARTSARSRELAVRSALGGSRWHLLRQMFAENALLALAGSVVGLGVAYAFIRGVEILGPPNVVGGLEIPFDVNMLVFTAAAGILSGLLFGIAPAWQLARGNSGGALNEGGRSGTAGREKTRLRSILVTAEVALALVLSIGAGLLMRSLSRLQHVDTGFRAEDVMSAVITLPEVRYKEPEKQLAFFHEVVQRLKTIPAVTSAAAAYPLPFGLGYEGRAFQIVGREVRENQPAFQAQMRLVTPEFFSTLRIPLKRGRTFTDQDTTGTERVTIIDETLAQLYWPGEDPLGQQIRQGGEDSRIVGIVGRTKQSDLASEPEKVFYYPFYQQPAAFATLVVRANGFWTGGSAAGLDRAIQGAVSSLDPAQSIYDAKTMEDRVSSTLAGRRFTVALLGLFAATAVFLAALGLYGVINFGVTQRTQEIGIRMALGAQRGQVLGLIIGRGMRITMIGLGLGALAAAWIARWFPNQLFRVSAYDPITFASMAILLAAVALFASYVPARRAMNLDPVEACRYE